MGLVIAIFIGAVLLWIIGWDMDKQEQRKKAKRIGQRGGRSD